MSFWAGSLVEAAKYTILLSCVAVLNSCQVNKYLGEDEYLLKKNQLVLKGDIREKRNLAWELETLYKQTPNRNFLFFFPRESFYLSTQDSTKTTSFNRWKRRVLGEPPAIFQDSLAQVAAQGMTNYLHYKGYYNAEVFYEDLLVGRKGVKITYYANAGTQFTIDSVFWASTDPQIDSLLQTIREESPLKPGRGVEVQLFEQERERITRYLRNHGYATFYSNYIDQMAVDTFQRSKHANLMVRVLPPFGDSVHLAYQIASVSIYTDYKPSLDLTDYQDSLLAGYQFYLTETDLKTIDLSTLLTTIFLRPGDEYSQENFDKTNRQLSALGIFRFVRIKQDNDSIQPGLVHFTIQLTPNKLMEVGGDLDFSFTNRSGATGTGNLIGVSLSPSLRNRNLFGGAESLYTNLSAGVELNTNFSGARLWNTIDLSWQWGLDLPRFRDFLGIWRGLYQFPPGKDRHLLKTDFYQALRENATTRLTASYNYLLIIDWYRYNLLNLSWGYDFRRSRQARYLINHLAIDFLLPQPEEPFKIQLARNPFLERSFGQQVLVSLLFRDIDYVHNSRVNRYGESHLINLRAETAGGEIGAVNALYNTFFDRDTFQLGDSIDFSQYLKLEADLRFYKQYSPKRSLATRINVGIARPFGFTSDVPYVKQFYVGGPNSIRAWAPRGLGPGGYPFDTLSLNSNNNNRLYQTGDIKMELNVEYRFEIFWLIKGALFVDAGNVWTFRQDENRPGSQWLFSQRTYNFDGKPFVHYPFYRQIAVAAGFGLRFDLSFFIFRLDLATRLRNSFPDPDVALPRERDWWYNFRGFGLRDIAFNLGLGYPF